MPRTRHSQAIADLSRFKSARLLYLSRNPTFQGDLQSFRQLRDRNLGAIPNPAVKKADQLAGKWDLDWLDVIELAHGLPTSPPQPVFAWKEGTLVGLGQPATESPLLEHRRFLFLKVDLQHPVESLVPLVEQEIRLAAKSFPRGRRRLDHVRLHLEVFDRAADGETFASIAATVRRKPSTIKTAYLTACRNIFGSRTVLPKRRAPLAGFDPKGHCEHCSTCSGARSPEEMCGRARAYASVRRPRRSRAD
jgi:hypothetical protein